MSDDYQVRKDIDRIYRDVYSLDDDKINVVKFKDDEDDKSDLKQYGTIDKIFEVYGLGDVSARTDEKVNSIDLFNLVYPVGCIYMSVNDADPSMLFGGTWERLKDRFLLGSGDTYTNGNTGGEESHTLSVNEMPSHTHTQNSHSHGTGNSTSNKFIISETGLSRNVYKRQPPQSDSGHYFPFVDVEQPNFNTRTATGDATATNQNTGGGQAHNNMPPYLVVNIWKRTA